MRWLRDTGHQHNIMAENIAIRSIGPELVHRLTPKSASPMRQRLDLKKTSVNKN